jgi:hypothetical protein
MNEFVRERLEVYKMGTEGKRKGKGRGKARYALTS